MLWSTNHRAWWWLPGRDSLSRGVICTFGRGCRAVKSPSLTQWNTCVLSVSTFRTKYLLFGEAFSIKESPIHWNSVKAILLPWRYTWSYKPYTHSACLNFEALAFYHKRFCIWYKLACHFADILENPFRLFDDALGYLWIWCGPFPLTNVFLYQRHYKECVHETHYCVHSQYLGGKMF